MFRRTLWAGFLGLCATTASAAPFSYDFVQAGVGEEDEGNAFFVDGSKSVNRNLFVLGSVYGVDTGRNYPGHDGKGYYVEGGLGYVMPLAPRLDGIANAQVLYGNIDQPGDDSDLGMIARAGARYMPVDRMEVEGAVAWSNNKVLVSDGFGFDADARYQFTPLFSAAIGYSKDTELDGAFLNVRYQFR